MSKNDAQDDVMLNLQNLKAVDHFNLDGSASSKRLIHIRVQQRNNKKTVTSVEGIDEKYSLETMLKYWKKEFCCNGNVVNHEQYGRVIQLQGDHREHVENFLIKMGIADEKEIKKHGF